MRKKTLIASDCPNPFSAVTIYSQTESFSGAAKSGI
jgi:hypothetical protein